MLRLGKLTDYATVLMTALAAEPARVRCAQDLADQTRIGAPTVAKLLKTLARAGLVESVRGARGGYRLRREPSQITVADIVCAVEGPIGLTECAQGAGGCSLEQRCGVRGNWLLISHAIRAALESVSLAQMAAGLQRPPTAAQREVVMHRAPAPTE